MGLARALDPLGALSDRDVEADRAGDRGSGGDSGSGPAADLYYIPPRYPNGFASGKPADYFTEAQAREALDAADQIIRFCEGHLLDRDELLQRLRTVAAAALEAFPELREVRLIGSLAAGTHTGHAATWTCCSGWRKPPAIRWRR